MPENMKIIIIGTTASGLVGFRKELILGLVESGHQVYTFAMDYTDKQRTQLLEMGVIPEVYSLNRTGINPFADFLATIKLAKKIKKIQPNLVFSYFSKPAIFGTLAAKLAGVSRRVAMLEGLGFTFTEQPNGLPLKTKVIRSVQVLLYRLAFPFLDRLIFLNPDDPVDLLDKYKIKAKQVSVLGGIGLNLADYPYSEPKNQSVRFIFIGRLLAEKGINEYVAAAQIVKQQYPNTEFVVLGGLDEGNPGGLTQKKLDTLIEQGLIIYPGHVENVNEWIAGSSVFVLPSYYREGVPRSTQEAMAIGRAIITTDVPGCRETVVDGVNGFLVSKWSPEQVAKKMIYFIEHPTAIKQMGLESHRLANEKFDASIVNERLIKMLLPEN
ncbi:glycosyltransferase family 4 protein [Thiopseudomonas alkaliphila]|uniref:glycosyltransferase family 4 protein n=1 Tax=Thiopseudomonas alkaliphila TaxID=1697053 RepID=UPI002576C497|nr:glycosyltransferase family 4 protein [Thiopseudomonas alkaliphila]